MSNFVSYDNAEDLMTGIGNKLKVSEIEWSVWNAMTDAEKETYCAAHPKFNILNPPEGGSGGHTIEDANGTDLTQRDTLQFSGYLKTTDDSTNQKTMVDDTPTTVTWTAWQAMTDQQKAGTKWRITDVPEAEGSIDADLITELWSNSDPSASFASQNITLSSGDYDFLFIESAVSANNVHTTSITPKGESCAIALGLTHSGSTNLTTITRNINYVDATNYTASDCLTQTNGSTRATQNTYLIPIKIYGIKKTITLKFSALAKDVQTTADHCMLSDGVTDVETALSGKVSKSGDTMSGSLTIDKGGSSTSPITSDLALGNNIPSGTAGTSRGRLHLWGSGSNRTILRAFNSTADRTIDFPDKSGTVALEPTEESGSLASYIQSGFTGSTDVTYYKKGNIVTIRSNGPVPSSTGSDQIFLALPSNLATKIQTFSNISNAAGTILGLAYINDIYLAVNIATVGGMYFSITYQC